MEYSWETNTVRTKYDPYDKIWNEIKSDYDKDRSFDPLNSKGHLEILQEYPDIVETGANICKYT